MLSKRRGESTLAQEGWKKWKGKKRPRKWRKNVWGLVVHTTGAGLPAAARKSKQPVLLRAHNHYLGSRGTHYVIGYAGEIVQVANEAMRANGVGMSKQISMIENHPQWFGTSFHHNLAAQAKWLGRWDSLGVESPLDLYPALYANACYVHCEMPPCVFWDGNTKVVAKEPHRPGLRFTTAQHQAVVKLAVDIADRNRFPEDWWLTGRLVGHEDLSPLTRGTRAGCWDPGWLRKDPWFDWVYVKEEIIKVYEKRAEAEKVLDEATEEVKNADMGEGSEQVVADAFVEWVKKILRIKW